MSSVKKLAQMAAQALKNNTGLYTKKKHTQMSNEIWVWFVVFFLF